MNQKTLTCEKKDHDGFDLICGYPIPCPWHTVIIDLTNKTENRLSDIRQALRKGRDVS